MDVIISTYLWLLQKSAAAAAGDGVNEAGSSSRAPQAAPAPQAGNQRRRGPGVTIGTSSGSAAPQSVPAPSQAGSGITQPESLPTQAGQGGTSSQVNDKLRHLSNFDIQFNGMKIVVIDLSFMFQAPRNTTKAPRKNKGKSAASQEATGPVVGTRDVVAATQESVVKKT